jgi:leader peptidase (prepilin peptidase)/N-methyltransferase
MIAVTLIDFDARIIPDAITLPGITLGILAALLTPVTVPSALIGAALGFALLWGLGWGYRKATGVDGMGGGDVKLAAMLGAFLGWPGLILTVFGASLLGTVTGVAMMARGKGGRRTALPFGTFLAPVGLGVYVWGPELIRWYFGLMQR